MTKSDQDLCEKLATEYSKSICCRTDIEIDAKIDFEAGFDSRQAQVDQLRAEVESLQSTINQLKAMAERLAQGLGRCIRWVEVDTYMKEGEDWNDLAVARHARAEWAKLKGEK